VNGEVREAGAGVPSLKSGMPGFAYLGLLLFIAIMGIGLGATGVVFHQQAQREKEKQLLFAGDQVRRAIGLYYERSPGGVKQFPQALEDLLQDRRYPGVQRYLRRIYVDPMTLSKDWKLIPGPDGGIMGVYSAGSDTPLKTGDFPTDYESFKDKGSYAEWKFQYAPAADATQALGNNQPGGIPGKAPPGTSGTPPRSAAPAK
jgi:type II secretory pathway pseudopilin PulG